MGFSQKFGPAKISRYIVQQLVYWRQLCKRWLSASNTAAVAEYAEFCPFQEQIPCQQISATESATIKSCRNHKSTVIGLLGQLCKNQLNSSNVIQQMSEVSKTEIFSPYTPTGCCFPASMPGTDKLQLSMVAIPVDPLLYFSYSIVRKPGGVQVLRSANREKLFLGSQPEVLHILRCFLSTYVYYIIHGFTYAGNSTVKLVRSDYPR